MTGDVVIFADANQYLDLFRLAQNGKRLLEALEEQRSHLFVTRQVVDEVDRKKLEVVSEFLFKRFDFLPDDVQIPDHLLGIDDRQYADLKGRLKAARDELKKLSSELNSLTSGLLERVSTSEDDVSRRLQDLFANACDPSDGIMQRARLRRELGNAPGKRTDPLGDQLSWEQLLEQCVAGMRLWLLTNDSDYITRVGKKALLNPLLHKELAERSVEVYCFTRLEEGLRHFAKNAGVEATLQPTEQEIEEIQHERTSLARQQVEIAIAIKEAMKEALKTKVMLGTVVSQLMPRHSGPIYVGPGEPPEDLDEE